MAKKQHISFTATITPKLIIEVNGKYSPAYHGSLEDPEEPAEFECESIDFIVGDVVKLLDHIDCNNITSIFEWIEELCFANYNY